MKDEAQSPEAGGEDLPSDRDETQTAAPENRGAECSETTRGGVAQGVTPGSQCSDPVVAKIGNASQDV